MQAGSYDQSLMQAVLKHCLGIVWGEGVTGASQNVAGEDARSSAVRTRVRVHRFTSSVSAAAA